jgi:hypothetical protein
LLSKVKAAAMAQDKLDRIERAAKDKKAKKLEEEKLARMYGKKPEINKKALPKVKPSEPAKTLRGNWSSYCESDDDGTSTRSYIHFDSDTKGKRSGYKFFYSDPDCESPVFINHNEATFNVLNSKSITEGKLERKVRYVRGAPLNEQWAKALAEKKQSGQSHWKSHMWSMFKDLPDSRNTADTFRIESHLGADQLTIQNSEGKVTFVREKSLPEIIKKIQEPQP